METEPTPREEQIALSKNRAQVYAFLSRMYEKEITVDLLKDLSSTDSPLSQINASAKLEDPDLRKGFEMVSSYLRKARERDPNKVKLELAAEYADLFLGIKRKPAHPSESVYLSEDHTMYQAPRTQVMHEYWKAGVDKVKQFTEPEDHIAIELQFMEYLCRMTTESLEKNDIEEAKKYLNAQKAFYTDHLIKWVPQFARDILESGEIDFYKGVAHITRSFINSEGDSINSLLQEIK